MGAEGREDQGGGTGGVTNPERQRQVRREMFVRQTQVLMCRDRFECLCIYLDCNTYVLHCCSKDDSWCSIIADLPRYLRCNPDIGLLSWGVIAGFPMSHAGLIVHVTSLRSTIYARKERDCEKK